MFVKFSCVGIEDCDFVRENYCLNLHVDGLEFACSTLRKRRGDSFVGFELNENNEFGLRKACLRANGMSTAGSLH